MKTLTILLVVMSLCGFAFASEARWETVAKGLNSYTSRMKVPHGWIVQKTAGFGFAMCYVPDENHEWRVE